MIETISSSAPWIGLIFGYGILTHGVVLLNDGLFWDGWILDVWQQNKDWDSMRRFFSEVGLPTLSFEHRMLGRFSWRQMAYRAISVGSILIIAVVVFLTAVYTNAFSPPQAAVISLLLLSYPAYAVTFEGAVSLQYTFKIALFYVGCFFAITTIDTFDAAHIFLFAGSLIFFSCGVQRQFPVGLFWGIPVVLRMAYSCEIARRFWSIRMPENIPANDNADCLFGHERNTGSSPWLLQRL